MTRENIKAGMPIRLTLEKGVYFRCNCGRSVNLPFCDGAHQIDDKLPTRFEIKARREVFLCSCGETKTAPFCDESCGVLVSQL